MLIFIAVLYAFIKAESFFVKYKTIFKIPVLLGVSSYSLYLLHEPLISLKNYLVHEYLPLSLQKAFVLVGIMIIPVLTHISYMLFEKPFIGSKSKALKIKQVE
ncbi:MAG: hypothetical protein EOP48_25020 [Sphingobacteriales bacterium]|nr:MAG: hypothetical protein EOP48_25020 [Sphingobacteriales bacterium]